jgi:hypothetical protein
VNTPEQQQMLPPMHCKQAPKSVHCAWKHDDESHFAAFGSLGAKLMEKALPLIVSVDGAWFVHFGL